MPRLLCPAPAGAQVCSGLTAPAVFSLSELVSVAKCKQRQANSDEGLPNSGKSGYSSKALRPTSHFKL